MSIQVAEAPPQLPVAPPPGGAPIAIQAPLSGRPLTGQEISALRNRRSELSSQLSSAAGRRKDLADELSSTEGPLRAGIEARIAQLDGRILRIEADIDATGQTLTNAGVSARGTSDSPRFPMSDSGSGRVGPSVAGALVFAFVAVMVARVFWRRNHMLAARAQSPESDARMERIEQAVDAIAIEVERISEAQRFSSRLLAEGVRPAEPIKLPVFDQHGQN